MQPAAGISACYPGDLPDRLNYAELAVDRAYRDEYRVISQQLFQIIKVDLSVAPDTEQIDLISLLPEKCQRAAYRRMFKRRGDNMLSVMTHGAGSAFDSEVIGFAGSRRPDYLGGQELQP